MDNLKPRMRFCIFIQNESWIIRWEIINSKHSEVPKCLLINNLKGIFDTLNTGTTIATRNSETSQISFILFLLSWINNLAPDLGINHLLQSSRCHWRHPSLPIPWQNSTMYTILTDVTSTDLADILIAHELKLIIDDQHWSLSLKTNTTATDHLFPSHLKTPFWMSITISDRLSEIQKALSNAFLDTRCESPSLACWLISCVMCMVWICMCPKIHTTSFPRKNKPRWSHKPFIGANREYLNQLFKRFTAPFPQLRRACAA